MSRQHRRIRSPLIALGVLVASVGILCLEYKFKQSVAAAPPPAAPLAQVVELSAPTTEPAAPPVLISAPVVDIAPTTEPSTRPSSPQAVLAASVSVPTAPATSNVFDEAQEKITAGKLLDARTQLNSALQSSRLDDTQANSAKAMITQISQTVVFGHARFPEDPYGGVYVVHSGDSLAKIANVHDTTWNLLSRINGIDPKHLRAGATIKVLQGPFFAVVDKGKFTMDVYLGGLPGEKSSMYVTTYPVGLGRDDSTPTGTWMIEPHHKLKHPTYYSPRGEGVIAADDPKNPLGGYWIGLSGTEGRAVGQLSYGIHGTIEPDSIGKQSSMGCIRLRADDIAVVFDLMVEGKSMVQVKE